jgi:hypothetical protein
VNHVEKAEIEILFGFLNSLIDWKKDKIYMSQEAFSKLFFEIILRLDYSVYSENVFDCFERCFFFLNIRLKYIRVLEDCELEKNNNENIRKIS